MYFKDNNKSGSCYYSGFGHRFPYYEFSKTQHWIEIGQRLQKIFFLYLKLDEILTNLEADHGQIKQSKHDKGTGYVSTTAKPISNLVDPEEKKYICRLIETLYRQDLHEIVVLVPAFKELRPYENLKTNLTLYGNPPQRKKIEQYFDYITLNSLKQSLGEFYDIARKTLDDKTNEIVMPEPNMENCEFFHYYLSARDCYCEDKKDIALAVIRKGIEDILIKMWFLHFDDLSMVNLDDLPVLDNLPGFLKNKSMLDEQEFREIQPLIKYGNSGIHVVGEIPIEELYKNCKNKLNDGITIIETLTKKYAKLMREKKYGRINITRTGWSVGSGVFDEPFSRR